MSFKALPCFRSIKGEGAGMDLRIKVTQGLEFSSSLGSYEAVVSSPGRIIRDDLVTNIIMAI